MHLKVHAGSFWKWMEAQQLHRLTCESNFDSLTVVKRRVQRTQTVCTLKTCLFLTSGFLYGRDNVEFAVGVVGNRSRALQQGVRMLIRRGICMCSKKTWHNCHANTGHGHTCLHNNAHRHTPLMRAGVHNGSYANRLLIELSVSVYSVLLYSPLLIQLASGTVFCLIPCLTLACTCGLCLLLTTCAWPWLVPDHASASPSCLICCVWPRVCLWLCLFGSALPSLTCLRYHRCHLVSNAFFSPIPSSEAPMSQLAHPSVGNSCFFGPNIPVTNFSGARHSAARDASHHFGLQPGM